MVSVRFEQISKRFGETVAVNDVTFEVARGELFFLLGPSGCGKSTLLRTVAGFCDPDHGRILFDDRDITSVPPHRRHTGMVFQNYALWPHMTVAENVAYGLEVRKVAKPERDERVHRALDTVRMGKYADRRPNQLSGGQQQRIALARALVIEPDVVLLDEPLSNLDAKLRLEMRDEIRRIHRETGITTVYVTHDQKEALSMADRMAVMCDGRVEQVGSPRDVYARPVNRFVAQFIGETNLLAGTVRRIDAGRLIVETVVGEITASQRNGAGPGDRVLCSIRPEAFQIVRPGHPCAMRAALQATVQSLTYLGEVEQYDFLGPAGVRLRVIELNPGEPPAPGESVSLAIDPKDVVLLPQESPEPS